MVMRSWIHGAVGFALLALAVPSHAEVLQKDERGFVVRVTADAAAAPAESWRVLVAPASWWQDQHTFSGEAANLSLDPVAGGCFCEKLPLPKDAPAGLKPGGVQHMRVVYAEPPRALRLAGALGPLQSEALTGALTITLKGTEKGTRVLFEYVVGGYMRYKTDEIAPAVDRMLQGQVNALAARIDGGKAAVAVPVPAKAPLAKVAAVKAPVAKVTPAKGVATKAAAPKDEAAAREQAQAAFDAALGKKGDDATGPRPRR